MTGRRVRWLQCVVLDPTDGQNEGAAQRLPPPVTAQVGGEVAVVPDGVRHALAGSDAPGNGACSDSFPVTQPDAASPAARSQEPAPVTGPATAIVWAVVPCYNRASDLGLLLRDVSRLDLTSVRAKPGASGSEPVELSLRLVVVDNASDVPLAAVPAPAGLDVQYLRLEQNVGGSGGFNAGLARVLTLADEERSGARETGRYVWLLDSDARVLPDTLAELVRVMLSRPDAAAVGSAIADPQTGRVFEIGGEVDRCNGRFKARVTGRAGVRGEIECDYVAACSALTRLDAVRRTGLLPDVFLNADDVEWFIRMAKATGQRILASPSSVAVHPSFDRFATTARYYVARNCLGPLRALGLPRSVRFRRALHEAKRAVGQELSLRPALAGMHLAGLADSCRPIVPGRAPAHVTAFEPFRPIRSLAQQIINDPPARLTRLSVHQTLLDELPEGEREALISEVAVVLSQLPGINLRIDHARGESWRAFAGACRRWLLGPPDQLALVSVSVGCTAWFAGRVMLQVAPGAGYVIRVASPAARLRAAWRGARTLARGLLLADRASRYDGGAPPIRRETVGTARDRLGAGDDRPGPVLAPVRLSLAIIVLSYNRRETLRRTLERLARLPECAEAHVVVVDNASTDGSARMVASDFRNVTLLALDANIGVAALNTGVQAALSDVVLVLDDDAWPEPGVVAQALDLLAQRPDLAAVALHPIHPETRVSEWPFAASLQGRSDDRWPVMGCGNLVRRAAWVAAEGYDPAYFLYRNDTDLALKLLGMPRVTPAPGEGPADDPSGSQGVYFDPAWIVWHESHAAASKSARWHRLATRNWIWMARRHGRGLNRAVGIVLGALWAYRLAGLRPACHWATTLGVAAGLFTRPPHVAHAVRPTGRDFARLLRLHLGRVVKRRSVR